jgi:O-antigen ligase
VTPRTNVLRKLVPTGLERASRPIGPALVVSAAIPIAALVGWVLVTRPLIQIVLLFGFLSLLLSVGMAAASGWSAFEYAALLVCLGSALVNVPRNFALGPISLLGAITIIYASVGLALALSHRPSRDAWSKLRPLAWFVAWTVISFTWYPTTTEGFQNVAVFVTFLALAAGTAGISRLLPRAEERFYRWFDRAMLLAIGVYLVSVLLNGLNTNLIFEPRAFALFALLGVARGLSLVRYGSRVRGALMAIAAMSAIFLSLSRTALAIAVILIPLAWLDRRTVSRRVGVLLTMSLVLGLFAFASTVVKPLEERFSELDRVKIGGVTISVSGRGKFWTATWRSWEGSPWVGRGAGSSEYLPLQYLPPDSFYAHPHNDYLRILHDYGIVGAVLWLIGGSVLLRATRRAWRGAAIHGGSQRGVHLAAVLGMTALAFAMITDNVVVYIFFMAPLAMLVGFSLGRGSDDAASTAGPALLRSVAREIAARAT